MKIKILLGIILASTLFVGCKNDKTADGEKATAEAPKEEAIENFRVTLNVVAKKGDDFQIYYIQNPSETFSEEKSLWFQLKGSDKPQDIVFNLPKDIVPSSVRLDFGLNKDQESITLNSVDMEFFDKKFSAKGIDLGKYFSPLEPTKIDFATGVMTAIDKTGKKVEPALQPQETLNQEIGKLVK